ncbi:hypothetical protein HK096_005293, partial [Nowakowskiella sp. JEL0078]
MSLQHRTGLLLLCLLLPCLLSPAHAQVATLLRPNLNGLLNNQRVDTWGAAAQQYAYFNHLPSAASPSPDPLTDIANPLLASNVSLPNPRLVSNIVSRVAGVAEPIDGLYSVNSISELTTYWGEFVAQGDLSRTLPIREQADIPIPASENTGNRSIPFIRAQYASQAPISINSILATVRTPRSFTTSFLDASQIYGVDDDLLAARRDGYKFRMINITLANGLSAQLPIIYSNYNKSAEFTVNVNLTDPNPLFDLGVIG